MHRIISDKPSKTARNLPGGRVLMWWEGTVKGGGRVLAVVIPHQDVLNPLKCVDCTVANDCICLLIPDFIARGATVAASHLAYSSRDIVRTRSGDQRKGEKKRHSLRYKLTPPSFMTPAHLAPSQTSPTHQPSTMAPPAWLHNKISREDTEGAHHLF